MENNNISEHHVTTIWDLDGVPSHDLFFKFAHGFVHAALVILEEQCSASAWDYFNLMPAHFALEHGLELFLKGAILLGDKSVTLQRLSGGEFGHNLEDLYGTYRQIYNDDQFEVYNRINELIDWRAEIDDPRGLAARYPLDRQGQVYGPRNKMVDLEFELEIARRFANDLERLEREVRAAKGVRPFPIEQFRYRDTR